MTIDMAELKTLSKSTNWDPNDSLTAVSICPPISENPTIDLSDFAEMESLGSLSAHRQPFRFPSFESGLISVSKLHSANTIYSNVAIRDITGQALLSAVPNNVQDFFQHAERRLSSSTEKTAQYALRLLSRIKELATLISPDRLPGRMVAIVDTEDGSTTIEWICSTSRVGFVLDRERERDSSWFVVMPNGFSKSGYLYGNDGLRSLRELLEEFLTSVK